MVITLSINWPHGRVNGKLLDGWAGELAYPNNSGFDRVFLYDEMIAWIYENIKNPEDNVFWNKFGNCIYVQFRKRADMMWFSLRFGA